jgi:pyruvate,orthophosphate dikinase
MSDVYTLACGEPVAASAREVGGKAHNLMRMAALGLPVPPAFVLGTAWCARQARLAPQDWEGALHAVEAASGLRFGDARRPLLVSVRSGAPVSMPGMMETLLDIGLCDATLPGLMRITGNPRLAWDSYRRLVAGFGEVVAGVGAQVFEEQLRALAGERDERELDFAELRELTLRHLAAYRRETGRAFPQEPRDQLDAAIHAVFASWHSEKAGTYRRLKGLDEAMGTAVTVQRMAFGNAGGVSGAGVGFTRDPASGAPLPWVDFLFNAQGEDVVSGRRTAQGHALLGSAAPANWAELCAVMRALEVEFRDMQDFEFTIEQGRLFMLQTRDGKRTPQAAARIALDLYEAGLIDRAQCLERTGGLDPQALAVSTLAGDAAGRPQALGQAQSAGTGVAVGEIALDAARARGRAAAGASVLLVRADAQTEDLPALQFAAGLLTRHGSRTSHAAVVARQLGKVCLVGCEALRIDAVRRCIELGGRRFAEGDSLTLDGHAGLVYAGALHTEMRVPDELLERLDAVRAA